MSAPSHFLFVGNGQYANRGCEAIAKSSIRIIREFFPGVPVYNGNELGDYDQRDETEPDVQHIYCPCYLRDRRIRLSHLVFRKTGAVVDPTIAGGVVRRLALDCRAIISMGGDLYGLSHGPEILMQYVLVGEAALKAGKPFVIWGATIGNLDADRRVKELALRHFRRCPLILVRDRSSLDYLGRNGVSDNVRLVADPAFTLEPQEPRIPLSNTEPLEETIGFNLAASYGRIGNLGDYRDMIELGADCVESLIRETGRPVMLIPHIVAYPETTYGNDTLFLSLVRECLAARRVDVSLLPSCLRSWEIKWVLGRLHAYVGSRWHSTVGALSSATPTVSIGFSEKAPALNELLLGHTRFALDCRELTPERLTGLVSELLSEHDVVASSLRAVLPEIKALARSAGEHLWDLLAA